MKYGTYFYVVILCQVYKSSVIFNTITTSFKKSRKNINYIVYISNLEHFDRGNIAVAYQGGQWGRTAPGGTFRGAAKLDRHLKFGWRKKYWENFLGQRKKKVMNKKRPSKKFWER